MLERAPSPAERRRGARLPAGTAVYPVELGAAGMQMLIDLGWLAEHQAADRAAVGQAVAALLRDAAGQR